MKYQSKQINNSIKRNSAPGRRIGLVIGLLCILGGCVTGVILLRSKLTRLIQPESYYSRYEAENLLELLNQGKTVLGAEEGDLSGFTQADAQMAVLQLMDIDLEEEPE